MRGVGVFLIVSIIFPALIYEIFSTTFLPVPGFNYLFFFLFFVQSHILLFLLTCIFLLSTRSGCTHASLHREKFIVYDKNRGKKYRN